MQFDISSFSSKFSRMKPSPSSTFGKFVRSKRASESVIRPDGISHFRPSGVKDQNWIRYKERINNEDAWKSYAEDLSGNFVKAERNGLRSFEKRMISNDVAIRTMNLDISRRKPQMQGIQRKPVPSPIDNDSGYASSEQKKQVKSNVNSEQLSPFDRQGRDFELQRVMQSIPAWVRKEHPHIAQSLKEDRSLYTSSMYDQVIKSYQAFIPEDFDPGY